jgi:transposase-like protein
MNQENPKAYMAEFWGSAVKLANESDKPIAQTARVIDLNENTLHTWTKLYLNILRYFITGSIYILLMDIYLPLTT